MLLKIPIAALLVFIFSGPLLGQSCLSRSDINSLLARVDTNAAQPFNKKLRAELLKMAANNQLLLTDLVRADDKQKLKLRAKLAEQNEHSNARFCEMLKQFGWPTKQQVDPEGVAAAFQLLRNCAPYELQRDLLPVLVAVVKKDESQKPEFAGLLDRLRVSAGMKQLFGTQAVNMSGFLVVYPIEDEAHVDERRAQFGLVPIAQHLRMLERKYQTPVVKARRVPTSELPGNLQTSVSSAINSTLLDTPAISEDDIIRVNTNLVSLNVSVFSNKLKDYVGSLTQNDFKILEDGNEQEITYFASINMPFDLVLLIDLSGSTSSKRDLIRKSTISFIENARPSDRIAIVTFADKPTVVSPLTSDRESLLASVMKMQGEGASNIWDALKFTLDQVVGTKTLDRRRAVVMMTDGVDSSIGAYPRPGIGSIITFADLLDAVGQTDTLVVPIYLDTEGDEFSNDFTKKAYSNARNMLVALANESGGSYYKARRVSDLNGVYAQVINDLGKIYSLGYKPTNNKRDGTWRNVSVEIVNRPDLVAHAKPGYYAK